jgi:N-acetylmuramoyl-L-alanine amidase
MKITTAHWIEGVKRDPIPGGSVMNIRRFLIIHFTAGWSAASSISFWKTPAARGSNAHIIIDRDGSITQCRPFNRTAGHAGASRWTDPNTGIAYSGLNSCSIGIELANSGTLARSPDVFPKGMGELSGKPVPRMKAKHKHGGPEKAWEIYPQAQLDACEAVSRALVERYNLDDLVGHEDVSPDRRRDPGPAFPMGKLRQSCGFPADIPTSK